MLKIVDALVDRRNRRVVEGTANKLEQKQYDNTRKFYEKHPKLCKFVVDHKTAIGVALDVALTADLIFIGYQFGKVGMVKEFNKAGEIGKATVQLTEGGKGIALTFENIRKSGLKTTSVFGTENPANLIAVANTAIEALKNNGVDLHTI